MRRVAVWFGPNRRSEPHYGSIIDGGRKGDTGRSIAASSATPISLGRRSDLAWLVAGVRNGSNVEPPKTGAAAVHDEPPFCVTKRPYSVPTKRS